MELKTSIFSPVIFRKALTRFWPVWALELLFFQLFVTIPLASWAGRMTRNHMEIKGEALADEVYTAAAVLTFPLLIALLGILVAVCMFAYLTKEREAYAIHSLPLSRLQLFVSHYLAGLVMLVVPYAVTYLLIMGITVGHSSGDMQSVLIFSLLVCLGETLIEVLLFYHLGCLVVMLTANSGMAVAVYAVLNVLCLGVENLCSWLGELFLYGFAIPGGVYNVIMEENEMSGGLLARLTPVFSLRNHVGIVYDVIDAASSLSDPELMQEIGQEFGRVAFYLIPAVLFLGLAVFLYQKRHIEAAGNMVSFSWGRPVFRIVFSFCGSLLFAYLFYESCYGYNISTYRYVDIFKIILVATGVGFVLCYLISNMILYRTFWIWKKISWLRFFLFFCVVVGGLAGMKHFGADVVLRIMPKVEAVQSAELEIYKMLDTSEEVLELVPEWRKEDVIQEAERDNPEKRLIYFQYTLKGEEQIKRLQEVQREVVEQGQSMNCSFEEAVYPVYINYMKKDRADDIHFRYPIILEGESERKLWELVEELGLEAENIHYADPARDGVWYY